MADRYNKIDFGSGADTPTGDTVHQEFEKTNDFMDAVENDLDLIDSQLNDLNVTTNNHTGLIDDLADDLAVLDGKVDALNVSVNDDIGLIDSKIDTIENDLNNFNSNFDNYYTKTENYSKVEVDNLIDGVEVDLTDYYNKSEIDDKLDEIESGDVDLTNYYNKTEVNNLIENVEVDLSGYATTDYVDSAIANIDFPETDLSNYYDKSEVYNKVEVDTLVAGGGGEIDLSNYYTKTEVNNKKFFGQGASVTLNGIAIGEGANAQFDATAIGDYTDARNGNAFGRSARAETGGNAFGRSARAEIGAIAIGESAIAIANDSVAIGNETTSNAYGGIAIGRYNDPILEWPEYEINPTSPLFIIGNGTESWERSNAFAMLQNGKSEFTNIASYKEDYSVNFTDNSLVNKKYVDDSIANSGGGGGETDLSNYYTKSEVDTQLTSYSQLTYVDTQLNLKADKSEVYTKVEVNNLIDDIDFPETDLSNYYTKSENYNKTEVDNLIDDIIFPETDLSNYYDKAEVDDLVANSGGEVDLTDYYTKSEVDNKVVFGSGASGAGANSVAMGAYTGANGVNSVAMGASAKATTTGSVAMGASANAIGSYSAAVGNNAVGAGANSVAIGYYSRNNSFGGISLGRFNDPILASPQTSFNAEHPLFTIGNGTSYSARSNAFVMLQNGKSEFTNIANYKEDYSDSFTDLSLVNKKYVDESIANNSGGNVGELVFLNNSTTVDINWNNDIVICDSATDIEILVPSGLDNLSFVIRNIGEGNVTLTNDGTSYFHATSSGEIIETGQITSVIINNNLIISTGTI